jgi:predicted nucleotidyltransferase
VDLTDIIVDDALRRRKAFENLDRNLKQIKERVINLDSKAEVYLFGSVARGENTLSSDIDVLILTNLDHRRILSALAEFGSPFEFHIYGYDILDQFKMQGRLIKI